MKKTLYSLMLSDDVVREIDILAHQMGTNRSNLVNQILAERVSVRTPEARINDIFSALEALMTPSRELVPFFEPNMSTMSMKSCLEYKYRPTVRYEVELARSIAPDDSAGTLSVILRTQSAALIEAMTDFFRLWKQIEDTYMSGRSRHEYALYDGKFVRSIVISQDMTSTELAEGINDYVNLFDSCLKAYIGGRASSNDIHEAWFNAFKSGKIKI